MKNTALSFVICLIINSINYCFAYNYIKDAQTEDFLYRATKPLLDKVNLKNVKFFIIDDDNINAFTDGNNIYINSGLIASQDDINVLLGVISHEIGHIVLRHVDVRCEKIDKIQKAMIANMLIGAVSLVNLTYSSLIVNVLSSTYTETGIADFYKHSQADESSADIFACNIMNKLGLDSQGLTKLFYDLHKKDYWQDEDNKILYYRTHPKHKQRISKINNFDKSKIKILSPTWQKLQDEYKMISLKLLSLRESTDIVFKKIDKDNSKASMLARAILYTRIRDYKNAIKNIDNLLELNPNNPYLYEVKGQILFEHGKKEALEYFNKAVILSNENSILRCQRSIMTIYALDKLDKSHSYIERDLRESVDKNLLNLNGHYFLGLYYSKIGKQAESNLELGYYYHKLGMKSKAKIFIKNALNKLTKNTPKWQKAQDLYYLVDR